MSKKLPRQRFAVLLVLTALWLGGLGATVANATPRPVLGGSPRPVLPSVTIRKDLKPGLMEDTHEPEYWTEDLPGDLAQRDFRHHVAFWHLPRTGGQSVANAMFEANHVPKSLIDSRIIDSREDCSMAVMKMLNTKDYPFFHLHFKDFTMVIALKRLGFQLFTLLRHPIRRIVSTYYYQRYVTKKWQSYPEKVPFKMMKRMIDEESLITSISGGVPGWSFNCNWKRCKYHFCEGLERQSQPRVNEKALFSLIPKFREVFHGYVGCGDNQLATMHEKMHEWFNWPVSVLPHENSLAEKIPNDLGRTERLQKLAKSSLEFLLFTEFCGADHGDLLKPIAIPEEND